MQPFFTFFSTPSWLSGSVAQFAQSRNIVKFSFTSKYMYNKVDRGDKGRCDSLKAQNCCDLQGQISKVYIAAEKSSKCDYICVFAKYSLR